MKIILEGIDNCGKSTLARKIQKEHPEMNYKIFHCTRETENNYKFFENLLRSDENIIFDRFHIGQFVYQSEQERRENKWLSNIELSLLERYTMRRMIHNGELKVLYVSSPIEHCFKECKKSCDDNHMTLEYLKELDMKYRYFINNISQIGDLIEIYDTEIKVTLDDTDFSKLPKIVGIDFDGVLCHSDFPHNGEPNYEVYDYILDHYKDWKKVLWTSRTNGHLQEAIEFCNEYFPDLHFDAINDNIEEAKEMTLNNTRKLYCDVLIDDCALQGIGNLNVKNLKYVR